MDKKESDDTSKTDSGSSSSYTFADGNKSPKKEMGTTEVSKQDNKTDENTIEVSLSKSPATSLENTEKREETTEISPSNSATVVRSSSKGNYDAERRQKIRDEKKSKKYRAAVREHRRAIKELQSFVMQLQSDLEKVKTENQNLKKEITNLQGNPISHSSSKEGKERKERKTLPHG